MTNAGVPVPPGFTICTETCRIYYESGKKVPESIDKEMQTHLAKLEKSLGKKFGNRVNPLLGLGAFRRQIFHARHDGHHPQPGAQRRND